MSLKKTVNLIRRNNSFLITAHVNPEADAIGSELSFMLLLKRLKKRVTVINDSPLPAEYKFLPWTGSILPARGGILHDKFDCLVFLDCSDKNRAGKAERYFSRVKYTLNIDHHISNTKFASVNWVRPEASSCCEMVYRLFGQMGVGIDRDTAELLYSGLVIDTGSFRFSNTSAQTHKIAANLILKGLSVYEIYSSLYENNEVQDIVRLGRIVSELESASAGRIVWVRIKKEALNNNARAVDIGEMALGLLRSIKGIELALVFKEIRTKYQSVRINFRSQGRFDCNKLAMLFGGGGHKNASGATVSGKLPEIEKKVIQAAKRMMSYG